jgi:hypothetical protein
VCNYLFKITIPIYIIKKIKEHPGRWRTPENLEAIPSREFLLTSGSQRGTFAEHCRRGFAGAPLGPTGHAIWQTSSHRLGKQASPDTRIPRNHRRETPRAIRMLSKRCRVVSSRKGVGSGCHAGERLGTVWSPLMPKQERFRPGHRSSSQCAPEARITASRSLSREVG